MNVSFNRVALVADQETIPASLAAALVVEVIHSHDGFELVADHGAQLLSRQLKATITHEEDGAPVIPHLLGRQRRTLSGSQGITNTTPENLADGGDARWKASAPDPKICRARLGDDDILGPQPLAHPGPKPFVRDDVILGIVSLGRSDDILRLGSGLDAQSADVQAVDHLSQHALHPHTGVLREPYRDMGTMEVDRGQLTDPVGKTSGVKVALDRTNREHQVRALNVLTNAFGRAVAGVNATIVGKALVYSTLAHGGNKGREIRFDHQFVDLVQHLVISDVAPACSTERWMLTRCRMAHASTRMIGRFAP